MPAIALQALRVAGDDGVSIVVAPGDAVPGYDNYSPMVQSSLRSTGRVRDLERDIMHLSSEGGYLHFRMYPKHETLCSMPETEPEVMAEVVAETLACGFCERTQFASPSGLARHITRMHPEVRQ